MKIPFMRLDRQFVAHREKWMSAVERVFSHGRVLQGPEVAEFEQSVAAMFGTAHGVGVGSGTDALVLALKVLDFPRGGKAAVTALSFVASASAIVLAGGEPVFVDVDPDHYCAREDTLLELVRKREVDAIIAVHLFGQMMELEEIYAKARENNIIVIEDAAQCLGATRRGFPPGRHSDAVCLSFDPMKVIGAQGSGGMVLANSQATADRLRRLRYHGHAGNRQYTEIGHNSQLATVQAAILQQKLAQDPTWRARRQEIAEFYTRALKDHPHITPPKIREHNTHVFHKYAMRVPTHRDSLAAHLKENGIATAIHYTTPLHHQPCFKVATTLPTAEQATQTLLSLPIYPELTPTETTHITQTLQTWRP